MTLVRGNDANTGVMVAEQSAWATPKTVYTDNSMTGFFRVPIISETLTLKKSFFQKSREQGLTGAQELIEPGRSLVEGEIKVQPRFNAPWFHILLAHLMGDEVRDVDRYIDSETPATNCNRHSYQFSSTLPPGLTLRIAKSGTSTSGPYEQFSGGMIGGCVWDQPEDGAPTVAFRIIAKFDGIGALGGALPTVANAQTHLPIKARDLSHSPGTLSKFHVGSPITSGGTGLTYQQNFRSFTLTIDRHYEAENAFLNSPDAIDQPGPTETRDIRVELRTFLEQDYAAQYKPFYDFANGIMSKINIVYAGLDEIIAGKVYAFRLDFPSIAWELGDPSLKEAGAVPTSFTARAIQGSTDVPNTGSNVTATDMRFISAVKDAALASGGDADQNFSTL